MNKHHPQQLIIFARAPVYGTVKKRLAKDIGKLAALDFYQRTLDTLLDRLRHGPWELSIATASTDGQNHRAFDGFNTMAQSEGDLGQRMLSALEHSPSSNRIIIGSDIPEITALHVQDAFDALTDHEIVFGPATDGGFWLVGCRTAHSTNKQFMQAVRWSSENALADTLMTLPDDCSVATVSTLSDVDDGPSYHRFLREAGSKRVTSAHRQRSKNNMAVVD